MTLYAKLVRWEVWNNYDWCHPNHSSEPIRTTLWYYEDELPLCPFEKQPHQVIQKGVKFVKYEPNM